MSDKRWTIQYDRKDPDRVVKIYDAMDANGNGNIRFHGDVENALTHFAMAIDDGDKLRAENERLKADIAKAEELLRCCPPGKDAGCGCGMIGLMDLVEWRNQTEQELIIRLGAKEPRQ